ncbi:uncharacterized protein C12orf73 homolog isoform X1 [Bos indicus x Bos taurus]|uniref:uncharacterized protein C12orf73 homolog isoform X1 n=1 Tax=Bos indicus x Bos taurus TaxID=30522 RepID=UPI000F7D2454|nr:uncharacterized protein C12orf73 homolog isoform X1 [Bos indicus x Bos taurus]
MRNKRECFLTSFAPEWPHLSTHGSVCDSPPAGERQKREQPPLCVGKHTRCNNPARARLKTRHLQGKFISLIPRTFGPARGHPSGSPAPFRRPLTRCRAPVQQALSEDARGCVLVVLPENVRCQPPGHVRRRRGGA